MPDALPNNAIGYPLIYIDNNGCVLCNKCAQKDIDEDIANPDELVGSIYWEGDPLICENCNCELESAYGPIEEK